MLKIRVYSIIFAAMTCAIPAFAVDGTTLINQSIVTAAGGFPYQINSPGSYKLSGNPVVADNSGIVISVSNVTLDLNGFSISCSACKKPSDLGISVGGTAVEIRNGGVNGFNPIAASGIFVSATLGVANVHVLVDHISLTNNYIGLEAGAGTDHEVSSSNVTGNFGGLLSSETLSLLSSTISKNTHTGIIVGNGLISGNEVIGNGSSTLDAGIQVSGTATVTNNTISNNSQFGLLGVPATNLNLIVGYGSNTFGGNGMDVSGPGLTSMKNNVSAGGVF